MTVYVEIVFLNNFFIDLLLCISTIFSRRRKLRKLRIIASAIIGAVVSVAYAFMPAVFKALTKVLLAPILTITFDKYKSVKDYIMSLGLFVIFTFVSSTLILVFKLFLKSNKINPNCTSPETMVGIAIT